MSVELVHRGKVLRRPPKAELLVDVTVSGDARWVVLPTVVSHAFVGAAPRAVTSLDVYDLGAVVVAQTIASEGVIAIPVPADGSAMLRSVPLAWWGELPASVEVEVVSARELLLDGRPLAEFVSRPLRSLAGADVDASPLAGQSTVVESVGGMGAPEMELSLVDGSAAVVTLPL